MNGIDWNKIYIIKNCLLSRLNTVRKNNSQGDLAWDLIFYSRKSCEISQFRRQLNSKVIRNLVALAEGVLVFINENVFFI